MVSEISPCGYPTHTQVTSCGTYPQNQASRYSCAVPVLPAAGRPMFAAVPVPPEITPWSAYVTRSASFCRRTSLPRPPICRSVLPSARSTRSSGESRCRHPRAASVAYAFVISSGVTACVPSVIEHTGSSGDRIPMWCAVSTIASGVTAEATCAKTVFTENAVACSSVKSPLSSSAAFESCQGAPSV